MLTSFKDKDSHATWSDYHDFEIRKRHQFASKLFHSLLLLQLLFPSLMCDSAISSRGKITLIGLR